MMSEVAGGSANDCTAICREGNMRAEDVTDNLNLELEVFKVQPNPSQL